MQMITKLKYVGVKTEDLLDIYVLYIRSIAEYCSVAFHSSLTIELSDKLERIQRTSLKIMLGEMYINYSSALEMSGLDTLYSRRTKRCLDFALKCVKHQRNIRLFPLNSNIPACKSIKLILPEPIHIEIAPFHSAKICSTDTIKTKASDFQMQKNTLIM